MASPILFLCRDCTLKNHISVWFPRKREWRYMTLDEFAQYRVTQLYLRTQYHG